MHVVTLKKILPILGIIILIIIILNLDINQLINIFLTLNPLYATLSLFAIFPILLMINIQWQILLKKQHIHAGFIYTLKNIFIGYFYGFITPGGFGGYLRALYLKYETNQPLPKCLSNIIIFNTIDLITLLILGSIGALLLSAYIPYLFFFILVFLLLVIILLAFFLKKERSYTTFTKIVESKVFATLKNYLDDPLDSFYEDLPKLNDLFIPISLSFIGWILQFSEFYLIAQLFNINIPFVTFLMITAVANVVGVIPISIYGLGTRDATFITLFGIYTILPERVILLSLFWFTIIWFTPSIIGAIITIIESKKIPALKPDLFKEKR